MKNPLTTSHRPQGTNDSVVHVSNEIHHHVHTHVHVTVNHGTNQGSTAALSDKPTVRVLTKAGPNYSLNVRDGTVILAPSDPNDDYQHWYKVDNYNKLVKDEKGSQAFSLVNKVTWEALKHSDATKSVRSIA